MLEHAQTQEAEAMRADARRLFERIPGVVTMAEQQGRSPSNLAESLAEWQHDVFQHVWRTRQDAAYLEWFWKNYNEHFAKEGGPGVSIGRMIRSGIWGELAAASAVQRAHYIPQLARAEDDARYSIDLFGVPQEKDRPILLVQSRSTILRENPMRNAPKQAEDAVVFMSDLSAIREDPEEENIRKHFIKYLQENKEKIAGYDVAGAVIRIPRNLVVDHMTIDTVSESTGLPRARATDALAQELLRQQKAA